jgi:hypothetical protein
MRPLPWWPLAAPAEHNLFVLDFFWQKPSLDEVHLIKGLPPNWMREVELLTDVSMMNHIGIHPPVHPRQPASIWMTVSIYSKFALLGEYYRTARQFSCQRTFDLVDLTAISPAYLERCGCRVCRTRSNYQVCSGHRQRQLRTAPGLQKHRCPFSLALRWREGENPEIIRIEDAGIQRIGCQAGAALSIKKRLGSMYSVYTGQMFKLDCARHPGRTKHLVIGFQSTAPHLDSSRLLPLQSWCARDISYPQSNLRVHHDNRANYPPGFTTN